MTRVITNQVIARKLFLPDPEECYRIIRQTRWPKGVTCPYCGSKEVQKNGHTPKGAQKYHCKNCGKYFNDLTGTIFDHHKLPINEAFYIIWSMPHKSTKLIAEELNRNYQAVLNFVHKVQKTAGNSKVRLEDVIEIDEVYPHAGSKGFKKRIPDGEAGTNVAGGLQSPENRRW